MARKNNAKNKEDDFFEDEVEFETPLLNRIKIDIKHKNETQKDLTNSIKLNDLTICTGPPGTGKTYLSCAQSLLELKQNKRINKIILVKSVTTLKSEEIGFLKGGMEEKMEPFVYSFTKNFEKLIGREKVEMLKMEKTIEVLPIAYMRGVNIDHSIIIVDEVQNITVDNIRTILTRLGEDSKIILLGDLQQIDLKNKKDSALKFLTQKFKDVERVGVIEFGLEDVVRHPLIKLIEPIFQEEVDRLYRESFKKEEKLNSGGFFNWFSNFFKKHS
jgi:phosphate starvation-inducible PhoH-like protein